MRRPGHRRAAATAAALALGAAGVLAQDAAAAPVVKAARYVVDVRADQVETWEYDLAADPADPCSAPSRGGGSQRVTIRGRGLPANVLSSTSIERGRALVAGARGLLTVPVTVDREGTYAVDYAASAGCDSGIYGDGAPPEPPDCGSRAGTGVLELEYTGKDLLEVGVAPGDLAQPFLQCPFWIGGHEPDGTGGLAPRRYRFAERRLVSGKQRRLVLHGGVTKCFDQQGFTACGAEQGPMKGKVISTFTLTWRRR